MLPILLDTASTLSRIQFAVTAFCHIIFPAVSVGLSFGLVFWYAAFLRTYNSDYPKLFHFLRNIFAVGFGIGVVLGTMMTFEFGLKCGKYANAVGPILGVTISIEVITAFFLEAGFIGIMLYGDERVSKKIMFFSVCMVAIGTLLSTAWIMSANSWMQTPSGYEYKNAQTFFLLCVVVTIGMLYYYHSLENYNHRPSYSNNIFLKVAFATLVFTYLSILFLFNRITINRYRLQLFPCSIAILAGVLVIGVYMFPYFLLPDTTIKSAASPSRSTLHFIMECILSCMPAVFAYNMYVVYVFRERNSV